jgi:transcriptional regulator with XRE-family HTH domain
MPGGYAQAVPNTTGGILLALRKMNGETQIEVAKATRSTQTDISKYERGQALPRGPMLLRLAKHYGVTVEELLPQAQQTTAERPDRATKGLGEPPSEKKSQIVTRPVTQAGVQPYTDLHQLYGSSQRPPSRAGGSHVRLALTWLSGALLSPIGWVYYLPVGMAALMASATRATINPWLLFCVPFLVFYPIARGPWAWVVGSIYTVAAVWGWWAYAAPRSYQTHAMNAEAA